MPDRGGLPAAGRLPGPEGFDAILRWLITFSCGIYPDKVLNDTVKQGALVDGFGSSPPAKPTGFLDLLPQPARERRRLEGTILATMDAWGYDVIGTPSVELLSTVELGVQ